MNAQGPINQDPTTLIRLAAIYLFALTGTGLVLVSSYLFLTHGSLPDQLYTLLTGVIGASFTLVGYHSNTLAYTISQQAMKSLNGTEALPAGSAARGNGRGGGVSPRATGEVGKVEEVSE